MTHRLEITLHDDLLARVDVARGFEPRASFVKRALESALARSDREEGAHVGMAPQPASTRAPVEKEPSGDGLKLDTPAVGSPANPSTADNGPSVSGGKSPAPSRRAPSEVPLPKIAPRRQRHER